jgi:hypothetical protein
MNEPKWTKGPWRIAGKGTIRAGQGWIADVHWQNREANARLIAAAPDLYAALEMAQLWLDVDGRYDMQAINAALSKAKGPTT